MVFRDKISDTKESASEMASEVKDTASNKAGNAKDRISESILGKKDTEGLLDDVKEEAELEVEYQIMRYKNPQAWFQAHADQFKETPLRTLLQITPHRAVHEKETRKEVIERIRKIEAEEEETKAWAYATMSYENFSTPSPDVKPTIRKYGGKAVSVAKKTDFKETYEYGKTGMKYGKKYGDYVPYIGDLGPVVGLVGGVGISVLDATGVISGNRFLEVSHSASDAADEIIENKDDGFSKRIATGGVAFADSHFGSSHEAGLNDILQMDYDEFAETDQ